MPSRRRPVTSRPIPFQITVVSLVVRRRHEDADVPTEHFVLVIAEEILRTSVEGFDVPLGVDDNDPVDGHVEDGVEPLGSRLVSLLGHVQTLVEP